MKVVIADTLREGRAFAKHKFWYPKQVKVCSPHNKGWVGHKFDEDDEIHILTESLDIWRSLEPAVHGARLYFYRMK